MLTKGDPRGSRVAVRPRYKTLLELRQVIADLFQIGQESYCCNYPPYFLNIKAGFCGLQLISRQAKTLHPRPIKGFV